MAAPNPYLKDAAASRYVTGGLSEAEALFGSPLPRLPPPELDGGLPVYFVRFHPHLGTILRRFLHALQRQLESEATGGAPADCQKEQSQFETILWRSLRSARASDRRLGLSNLFWLAHSLDVAECLKELEGQSSVLRGLKDLLPSFLVPILRRVSRAARTADEAADRSGALARVGSSDSAELIDALTTDGYAFTEATFDDFELERFLAANKRHRLSTELFSAIEKVLVREVETRLHVGDGGLLSIIDRHLPGLPREQLRSQPGALKLALNAHVMTYLFADAWQTGQSLMASGPLRAAAERRSSGEMMGAFLALVEGLKRFEILCHLRQAVRLGRGIQAEQELEERMRSGLRIFDFGAVGQVQNNAVTATVLFLDLRGFTQTSEGHISEGDLTRALYAVFDAFVPIVRRFGGSVDKFLGDGMMVTFGTEHSDPEAPLNAVRAAILCQETLARLRREGKSAFEMGVSIHHGRVYVARFVEDEERVQVTVIGRNVNLAGRLSSASKKPVDEEATDALPGRAVGRVTVDADGALVNEGIALSRAALVQIEKVRSLESCEEPGLRSMKYSDEVVDREVRIRYVGEAKFKGVRASFPTFEVDATEADAEA